MADLGLKEHAAWVFRFTLCGLLRVTSQREPVNVALAYSVTFTGESGLRSRSTTRVAGGVRPSATGTTCIL
ncbi:hypothetical protein D3C76_1385540 [compost metagenome]